MLKHAAGWLTAQQVTHVAMEATGIYSMPVYHALIEHGLFERVLVCNAGHVQNVPGRKTDLVDAVWLRYSCWSAGCCGVRSSRRRRSKWSAM